MCYVPESDDPPDIRYVEYKKILMHSVEDILEILRYDFEKYFLRLSSTPTTDSDIIQQKLRKQPLVDGN